MKVLLLVFALLLSGCAVKTWHVEGHSEVSNGLIIRVELNQWRYYPSDLGMYVFPVYLEIVNREKEPVRITRDEVFLVDNKGNQYNSLEPRDVVSMLRRGSRIGISFGFGYWSSPFGVWWAPSYVFPKDESYPDVVNKAFNFGEIQGGARLKGFVYFPEIPKDVSMLTLSVKGHRFIIKPKRE